MNKTYYAILRVRIEPDGRLQPLWYTVADGGDWMSQTVVNHEYAIALCTLFAKTVEDARKEFKENLSWFALLLNNAAPEAWFAEEEPHGSVY